LLIYLYLSAQQIALQKIEKLLSPAGLLFVGPAEQPLALEWGLVSAQMPLTFGCRPRPARRWNSVTPRLLESTAGARNRSFPNLESGHRQDLGEASRLADAGHLSEAAAICEAQLSQGQASAQVYYLLGLLRDAGGDERAFEYYRKALYLDPNHYELIGKMPTFTGARASVIWGEYRARQGMVIGVPATSNQGAELWFTQFIDY
jgi:chemotaxis protein methyltransferase WspC